MQWKQKFFVKEVKMYQLKAKVKWCPFFFVNKYIKKFTNPNIKKTRSDGYVYDLSTDYDSTDNRDIMDIQNYLMKKQSDINA